MRLIALFAALLIALGLYRTLTPDEPAPPHRPAGRGSQEPAPGPVQRGELKLATWNIAWLTDRDHLLPRDRTQRRPADVALLAGYARRLDADILALQEIDGPEAAARVYLYRHGPAAYRERLLIAWTRSAAPPERQDWRHRFGLPERWQVPRFPIKGADVLAIGVEAGPRVGEILRAAEEWWVEGGFAADEAALRAKLAELAAAIGGQTQRV